MVGSLKLTLGIFIVALSSHAATVNLNWELAAKTISPDGFDRTAALVNGQYPGPLLKANKGDTIFVNVNNKLNDPNMRRSTSIVCLYNLL